MKLPISLLLYVVALGLFGLAGWTFYQMLPMWKETARTEKSNVGIEKGRELVGRGRGASTQATDWVYDSRTAPWWASFKQVNLVGKLPPPPPEKADGNDGGAPPPPTVNMQPLEEILEIVALVHDVPDGQDHSYAIIRYKPTVMVTPPEWWLKENLPPTAAAAGPPGRDIIPAAPAARPGRGNDPRTNRGRGPQQPQSPPGAAMPTSGLSGREYIQIVYVRDLDARRTSRLWPEFAHIHLVRVADDARSAWFVREVPPAKAGEAPPPTKEEQLFKTSQNLSQDVLRALAEIEGRKPAAENPGAAAQAGGSGSDDAGGWVDVDETTRDGNRFNIGRKDQAEFQQNENFFDHVDVDVYRGSSMRGLIVRNVDAKLATKFGIAPGDVLLEVNNQPVESKAQAMQVGKAQYKRGVRTFVTKWLSNGTVVERTYQAPTK
ncbi:MAG: hypothetical protein JNN13_08540 [Planctomycetes bacterium]|nr:hypothetical protein [Planctomycetota bacterium]